MQDQDHGTGRMTGICDGIASAAENRHSSRVPVFSCVSGFADRNANSACFSFNSNYFIVMGFDGMICQLPVRMLFRSSTYCRKLSRPSGVSSQVVSGFLLENSLRTIT